MKQEKETVEQYVCSLVDILGQQERLIQLSGLDLKKYKNNINSILNQTYGVVKKFKKYTMDSTSFVNAIKTKHTLKTNFSSNKIEIKSFSDLIISYVSLRDDQHELQFEGIYFLLLSNCEVFLKMLAEGIALRSGVDLGIAIKTEENEIYGTALLKPYILESQVAKSIRIVIGYELYNYIQSVSLGDIESNESIDYNIKYAKLCMKLIKQDNDGEYILDYLSDEFKDMKAFHHYSKKAKLFLNNKYNDFKIKSQFEIAQKYQQAIKYFEMNRIF